MMMDFKDELLRLHYWLGNLTFEQILHLIHLGQLPQLLQIANNPFCSACQYGKMTKRPWRVKGSSQHMSTKPGKIVSVDQLESSKPCFIAQFKGFVTTNHYRYTTIFVDQFTGSTYMHLQCCITSNKTVSAKKAFE